MDRLDRFELQGTTYYQQYRKCNKPNCRCAYGEPHGPYWLARDESGQVSYIGKTLPAEVTTARLNHDYLLPEMVGKRRELINQADALARLIRNAVLSPEDIETVRKLGFGDALVSAAAPSQAEAEKQLNLV